MGARQKLNSAYVNGSIVAGVIAGVLTQSWTIFMVVSAIGLTLNMIGGEIRQRTIGAESLRTLAQAVGSAAGHGGARLLLFRYAELHRASERP